MKSQQAAEREEQQRIKNLVLNYDLREDDQHDGISQSLPNDPTVLPPLQKNPNTKGIKPGFDHYNPSLSRSEKSGRNAPRARRLNLSDVDWYETKSPTPSGSRGRYENRKSSASPTRNTPRMSKKPG